MGLPSKVPPSAEDTVSGAGGWHFSHGTSLLFRTCQPCSETRVSSCSILPTLVSRPLQPQRGQNVSAQFCVMGCPVHSLSRAFS